MQARPGGMPPANSPLVSIMPDGSELLAELLVPTRAAGFIKPGDEVRLQVEAYPFERFGFVMGNVASVSHSVLTPGEFLAPIEIKEAVYRVRVALSRDFVMAYGKKAQLRPGMSLRADIVIDRKPLWRQLIDPMLAAAKRAH
jgi:membrane fusion protein